uniref:Uncharacterized protein n=1 Tax=Oryza glumipatula TaxID=40148 RepID=A0A0D9ZBN9_9ORYZ
MTEGSTPIDAVAPLHARGRVSRRRRYPPPGEKGRAERRPSGACLPEGKGGRAATSSKSSSWDRVVQATPPGGVVPRRTRPGQSNAIGSRGTNFRFHRLSTREGLRCRLYTNKQ